MEQKSHGALIGSFIIVIILILGGVYFWQTSVKEKLEKEKLNSSIEVTPSVSDDTANLEGDLNAINLDNLDSAI